MRERDRERRERERERGERRERDDVLQKESRSRVSGERW